MKHQLLTFIAAGCSLLVAPLALSDEASQDVRSFTDLRVGRTNILCYQEPCPWSGISRAGPPVAPHDLLWSGETPPPMRGTSEDRTYLLEHYREHCTLISGQFQHGILHVASILGPC
jgi:hypothetical protein